MRVRKMDENGDMQFGHNAADIWRNAVDGIGQKVKTRLLLYRGEWFLDASSGMPWGGFPFNDLVVAQGQVLGKSTQALRDFAIKTRVLETNGVLSISDYSSSVDPSTRAFTVTMTIDTIFGQAFLEAAGRGENINEITLLGS